MKVSIHAGQRFLERVMEKANYNSFDVNTAIAYLEKALQDVVPNSCNMHFVIPGFENYRAIYRQNTVITIIPKGEKYAR